MMCVTCSICVMWSAWHALYVAFGGCVIWCVWQVARVVCVAYGAFHVMCIAYGAGHVVCFSCRYVCHVVSKACLVCAMWFVWNMVCVPCVVCGMLSVWHVVFAGGLRGM